jgi:DNA repair exonuclease SbcCD ATPase subunit
MGAAASLGAAAAGGSQTTEGGGFMAKMRAIIPSSKKYEDKETKSETVGDDEEDDFNDIEKLQKAHRKLGFEHARTVDDLKLAEAQNKELRSKLSEMITAIKQLKSELNQTVSDKEAAEAHLAQMANPEREAFMHKYALEKLREEFEKYQKDVGEEKASILKSPPHGDFCLSNISGH